jgi:hypothetical protein
MPLSLAFVMLLFIWGNLKLYRKHERRRWCGTEWWAPHFINQESINNVVLFLFWIFESMDHSFVGFGFLKDGFIQVAIVEVNVAK